MARKRKKEKKKEKEKKEKEKSEKNQKKTKSPSREAIKPNRYPTTDSLTASRPLTRAWGGEDWGMEVGGVPTFDRQTA